VGVRSPRPQQGDQIAPGRAPAGPGGIHPPLASADTFVRQPRDLPGACVRACGKRNSPSRRDHALPWHAAAFVQPAEHFADQPRLSRQAC